MMSVQKYTCTTIYSVQKECNWQDYLEENFFWVDGDTLVEVIAMCAQAGLYFSNGAGCIFRPIKEAWPLVLIQEYIGSILMKLKWPVPHPWCVTNHQEMQVILAPSLSAISKTKSSPQTKKGCSFRESVLLSILLPNQGSEFGTGFAE